MMFREFHSAKPRFIRFGAAGLAVFLSVTFSPLLTAQQWSKWRGPTGNGVWQGPKLPDKWPEQGLKRLWRQPIGGGYAGVVVTNDRVYTMDRLAEPQELERILCFDAAGGKPLWKFTYKVQYGDLQYGNGPRASPIVHQGRVYAHGALGHFHCLDAETGEQLWRKTLLENRKDRLPTWGLATSPVIYQDLVIVHPGAEKKGCLIAFDRKSGIERWRSLTDKAGYATPIIIRVDQKDQLVCWTADHVHGLSPANGKLLWSVPFATTYATAIATPIYEEGIVFVSSYWEGSKALRLNSQRGQAAVLWEENRNLRGLMSQPLYRRGYAYLLDKRHGLTCFELKTGKKIWDDGNRMTPKGRNPQASLVWLGDQDRVIILNSQGELILARLDSKGYQEQSRTKIIGPTWAHPAYAGPYVFARNDEELVCVSLLEATTLEATKGE